jgi:RHS repeat-associated protein
MLAMQDASAVAIYLTHDHLGSVRELTDTAGTAVIQRRGYDPWGRSSASTGSASGWAFTGRENDTETGLYYYRARYYDPASGRFLTEDPGRVRRRGGLYAYAGNNPVLAVDPTGLDAIVKYWNEAAHGEGHVGVGVNCGNTTGFYPTVQSACLIVGCSVPGWAGPDSTKEPTPADAEVTLHTDLLGDEIMCEAIKERKRNPGLYHLFSRNCASFVEDVLEAGGVKGVPRTNKPRVLFWNLVNR